LLNGKNKHGNISRALKHSSAAPMTALKRPHDKGPGKPVGSYATHPVERDEILHSAWDPITHGNVKDTALAAKQFFAKHSKHITRLPEYKLDNLSVESFKKTCQAGKKSAAGLDGWSSADLSILSDKSYGILVDFLNCIEHGQVKWPEHMRQTRTVFLSKDPNKTDDPLCYRGLKITSCIYRKWASNRLHALDEWVEQWDHPALHVVGGKGAMDAWLRTSLRAELNKLEERELTGGSIDIYKCFDQINRELLFDVAQAAGMPQRFLLPYFDFIDNLQVRFQVGEVIGPAHLERCSIPQGCPFSMALVALLTKIWVNHMETFGVEPRCLADDLLFTAEGSAHRYRAVIAMTFSRQFFHDLGAKVATNKCFMFSTCSHTRTFLSKYEWSGQGFQIPVSSSFRDLGSHLNLTNASNGATLTERMRKATKTVRRLSYMPIGQKDKEMIVRCNILPAALYGCESAHINQSALQALRSAIADAVGPKSVRRCVDATFVFTSCAKDLDPLTHILYNRIASLRRLMAKHPECTEHVRLIIMLQLSATNENRHNYGPIGGLLQHLHACNVSMGADFVLRQHNEPNINMCELPWQHLKKAIFDVAGRARSKAINLSRTYHGKIEEMDTAIIASILNGFGEHEANIIRYIATGAFWDEAHKAIIETSNGSCPHCGDANIGNTHMHWECKHINSHRKHKQLCEIAPNSLPQCVKVGMPPAMHSSFTQAYWGEHMDSVPDSGVHRGSDIGIPVGMCMHNRAICDNRTMNIALQAKGGMEGNPNARQVFLNLKSLVDEPIIPLPYKCTLKPPEQINVYTDGSWKFPLRQYFALGGAGVWWPSRNINTLRVSQAESDLAHVVADNDGVRLYTAIGGYAGSSTRTELAAGIIAMSSHGPVHIGSDSEAFVNQANIVLQHLKDKGVCKICWQTTSDGDLWQHFVHVAIAKTPFSIRITWVKGHATSKHVDLGITTEINREGNRIADSTADLGVKVHGEETFELAKLYTCRHKKYTAFMRKVYIHIVEAHMIHRELVRIAEAKDKFHNRHDQHIFAFCPLSYPSNDHAHHICSITSIDNMPKLRDHHPNIRNAQLFMEALPWQPCTSEAPGITWVQLYTLYRLAGFPKPLANPICVAQAKPSLAMQLAQFKSNVRCIVAKVSHSQAAQLFKPEGKHVAQLKGLAIEGVHASISCMVCIPMETQNMLAMQIIKLSRYISSQNLSKYIGNRKNLPMVKLDLKGKTKWDDNLPICAALKAVCCSSASADVQYTSATQASSSTCHAQQMHISICPNCGIHNTVNSLHSGKYLRTNLEIKIKCQDCYKSMPSIKWKCNCGEFWHNCQKHAPIAAEKTVDNKHPNISRKASKRLLLSASPEKLLDDDLKRESKSAKKHQSDDIIILEDSNGSYVTPGMLPQRLKDRFQITVSSNRVY
jgi:ribonuclease HI